MPSIFDTISNQKGGQQKSATWYRNAVASIADKVTARKLMNQGRILARPSAGRLNLFFYDPKTKDKLPYYDTFPLVLPLEAFRGGFMGINFHYVSPMIRFRLLNQLQRGEAASRRVYAIIDLEPSISDLEGSEDLEEPITSISFDSVTFAYPSTNVNVVNDVSFEVRSGGFLGIMGHTGAGKSTILKLVEKFYQPQEGEVRINGRNISDFTIHSVRSRIGFVSQDPFLFFGTVRDNVAYARDATEEEVKLALETAGAWEFVDEMEEGMDTMVGDRGVRLSGGQRARISLARALLMNPDVLILDEASAALDAETEKRIQQSLFGGGNGSNGKKRITIGVAHRLATIRNADEIISMVDGAIVERGTHSELLGNDSVYASQWAIQTGQIQTED